MKLNFWQVLGVLLLVIGAAWFIYAEFIATEAEEEQVNPALVEG